MTNPAQQRLLSLSFCCSDDQANRLEEQVKEIASNLGLERVQLEVCDDVLYDAMTTASSGMESQLNSDLEPLDFDGVELD